MSGAGRPTGLAIGGLLALSVYLIIAWVVLPPQAIWSPDEGAKLLQLQNLRVDQGRLTYAISYMGRELDPDLRFAQAGSASQGLVRARDGALYFQRLPVFPLLELPLFRWLGFYGLYLIPALGGAASSVLAVRLLEPGDRRWGMWALIAFGSPILIYSVLFWEHTLATCLGLIGAWLALTLILSPSPAKGEGSVLSLRVRRWIAVGIVLGISAYVRLEMVIFAVALLLACGLIVPEERRGTVWAAVAFGVVLLPYVPLHQAMFGQAVPDNALYLFYPFRYLTQAGWRAVPDLLIGPFQDEVIDLGWLGWVWAVAAVIAVASSFGPTSSMVGRVLKWTGLGISAVVSAAFLFSDMPYRSVHGLLFTTPWALLGICQARKVWQRGSRPARIIVLTTLLGLAGYAVAVVGFRAGSPQGGLEWGARFALTFYPLLALMAAWDLGQPQRAFARAIVSALLLLGVGFQVRGVWVIQHDKQLGAARNLALVEMPERYVVSDLWWLPLDTAPTYPQKAIFVAVTPDQFANWVSVAAARQVRQFALVTMNDAWLDNLAPNLDRRRLSVIEFRRAGGVLIYRVGIEPET